MQEQSFEPGPEDDLAGFCHDLRQYVATGMLMCSIPQQAGPASESARLEMIGRQFTMIGELISAQLDAESAPPPDVTNLVTMINECLAGVSQTRDVDLVIESGNDLQVIADHNLLRRAVSNVVDNAIRASGNAGIQVRVAQDHRWGMIEVTDHGPGFGRISRGMGKGMGIIDRAVRACGGSLEIHSGPEPGTRVVLRFPMVTLVRS